MFLSFHSGKIARLKSGRRYFGAQNKILAPAYEVVSKEDFKLEPKWSPPSLDCVQETYLLPPPNVTGKLHMGHALTVTIQDATVRFARLQGKTVRWVYGTDHAGIATQSVVERHLLKSKGMRKDEIGREAFVSEVWRWTNEHKNEIKKQLQSIGASLDYEREYFTLDQNHSEAVTEAFVRLFDRKLMKRAQRMVNWCPHLRTALSDLEVDKLELPGPTEIALPSGEKVLMGVADDFAYKLIDGSDEIVVRTTRLETMLGDVAVAVHPLDMRYKHLIGRFVKHPFINDKLLPIVADSLLVDPTLGTGAVKITPAHDPHDFACAARNQLPVGDCLFTNDGCIERRPELQEFEGQTRFQARSALRKRLADMGLYRGQTAHPMVVNVCSRSKDVIENILKWQWFIDGNALATTAQAAVANQGMSIFPSEQRNLWDMWLNNSQDWCVSRQLWWGHRIPAYRILGSGEVAWVAARSEEEARAKLGANSNERLEQDEDVLDTWFSSSLLPISIFGWPTKDVAGKQIKWMETGSDILFFWVARMVMVCTEMTGQLPFPHVHLHTMVRDKSGRKMSKSLGNVIDPLDVINGISLDKMTTNLKAGNLDKNEVSRATKELKDQFGRTNGLPKYGSDALRLALASYPATVPQVLFDVDRVAQARLFCNKLWQATRFILKKQDEIDANAIVHPSDTTHVKWLRSRLAHTMREAADAYTVMNVEKATTTITTFVWNDLCDVFLECSKFNIAPIEERAALMEAIEAMLIGLHPVAPDITTELWEHVSPNKAMSWSSINMDFADPQAVTDIETVLDITRAVRALRLRFGQQNTSSYEVCAENLDLRSALIELSQKLSRCEHLSVASWASSTARKDNFLLEPLSRAKGAVKLVADSASEKILRERAKAELERITKRIATLETSLQNDRTRMVNSEFVAKAPGSVLEKTHRKIQLMEHELITLKQTLQGLAM